ncbi:uncharacterized protein LOC106153481 isoform X2 [Lingula anatina]|uniref:Uncharacterized protein LOC106153481 isoform X2 n=1 Tax=Lingula anatina TaxID=7574 RepID=A0A1S3HBI1_LINAN|nr:uncharacterized protein LOC106153481 isoform X2 [Lingula anatina]|eukprot:XP_013382876.1 uncharacterized protein LOC106153481 isoform X2 [Lingula anatina]
MGKNSLRCLFAYTNSPRHQPLTAGPQGNQGTQILKVSHSNSTSSVDSDTKDTGQYQQNIPRTSPVGASNGSSSLLHGSYDEEANAHDFQAALNEWRQSKSIPSNQHTQKKQQPSLLDGTVNEEANAKDFQQALNEWRQGNSVVTKNTQDGATGKQDGGALFYGEYDEEASAKSFQDAVRSWRQGTDKEGARGYSPVKSPTVTMEHGTGTVDGGRPVNVEFHTHTVSYAEKLLLKKHRRTELGEMPPLELSNISPRQQPVKQSPRIEQMYTEDIEDEEINQGDRVNFQALFDAVKPFAKEPTSRPASRVSISDVSNMPMNSTVDQSSHFDVQEVDPPEAATSSGANSISQKPRQKSTLSAKSKSRPQSKTSPVKDKENSAIKVRGQQREGSTVQDEPNPAGSRVSSAWVKEGRDGTNVDQKRQKTAGSKRTFSDLEVNSRPSSSAKVKGKVSERPKSRAERAKSALQRRPPSATGNRVPSQMSDHGDGGLTKAPSDTLRQIARLGEMYQEPAYDSSIAAFFTAGVPAPKEPFKEKVIIPSKDKKNLSEKRPGSAASSRLQSAKVSNRLYQMAPRSWRPDSSLGDNVPDEDVKKYVLEFDSSKYLQDPIEPEVETVSFSLSSTPVDGASVQHSSVRKEGSSQRQVPTVSSATRSLSQLGRRSKTSIDIDTKRQKTPVSRPQTASGRVSRAIVVDGDDLSRYDTVAESMEQSAEDTETLGQLEWELASQEGRLTEDGKVSRMSLLDEEMDVGDGGDDQDIQGRLSALSNHGDGYDISRELREEELMDDFEEMERTIMAEEEVKALT